MKSHPNTLLQRMVKKAHSSTCHYAVVAAGIDHRNRIISIATNAQRFTRPGGGLHAEQRVMYLSPRTLTRVLIARVKRGKLLPIHPCAKCQRMAKRMGITIEPISR